MSFIDSTQAPDHSNNYHLAHANLLIESFQRICGPPLLAPDLIKETPIDDVSLAKVLYDADFVVVSHGTETDPIFNYANARALSLFELDWHDFVALPSRKSAEPVHRDERERLMKTVTLQGFIDDYSGVRVSSSGKRFAIKSAVVWNLIDNQGVLHGQAATFSSIEYL